jgi:hypothetical protein
MSATAINQTADAGKQNGLARAEVIVDCALGINTLAQTLQRLAERRMILRWAQIEMYGGEVSLLAMKKEIASAIRELACCLDAAAEANCEELFTQMPRGDGEGEEPNLGRASATDQ